MKNYIAVSRLCDKINEKIMYYKLVATNPCVSDCERIEFQRKLVTVLKLIERADYLNIPERDLPF